MTTKFRLPGFRAFGGFCETSSSLSGAGTRAKSDGVRNGNALLLGLVLTAGLAQANGITYTCGSGITTTQCSFLNSTVAGYYSSVFSNANAAIYISLGSISGIGSNYTSYDEITYSQYVSDLNGQTASTVDTAAHAALSSFDAAIYGSGYVVLPTALAAALGESINGLPLGVDSTGVTCNLGAAGCYNGDITMSSSASWYFRTGQIGSKYDFYTTAQHETDEVLGTGSCIATVGSISNWCGGVPSAADLFRYSSAGHLVPVSSLSTTAGAYFSYNGGTSNGASGAIYNSSVNGGDYADFVTNCNGTIYVQDASGCTGKAGVNIGSAETNILDAVGYSLVSGSSQLPTPEPGTWFLLGGGLLLVTLRRRTLY